MPKKNLRLAIIRSSRFCSVVGGKGNPIYRPSRYFDWLVDYAVWTRFTATSEESAVVVFQVRPN